MKRLVTCIIVFLAAAAIPQYSFGQTDKIFKTKYTVVHYADEKDVNDFIWRLAGRRFEFSSDTALTSNLIDRVVERVEAILDMYPRYFRIPVYLHRGMFKDGMIAFYEHKTKAIHISVDNVAEGVFAHEVAHAVIDRYFATPPSSKVQEILTQYVDRYLWSDY